MSSFGAGCGLTRESRERFVAHIGFVGRSFASHEESLMEMTAIGIDPRKRSHTAVVLDEDGTAPTYAELR